MLDAARVAGVQAVLLTDHDTLGARCDGWEGMHDGVLLLVGTEVSRKQGHYLAFGVAGGIPHVGRTAGEIAAAVRAAGGVGSPRTRSRRAAACSCRRSRDGSSRRTGGRHSRIPRDTTASSSGA